MMGFRQYGVFREQSVRITVGRRVLTIKSLSP